MALKFAIIAAIGLTTFAACMGAVAGFADLSLSEGKSRRAVIATATSHVLGWDGVGRASLMWR